MVRGEKTFSFISIKVKQRGEKKTTDINDAATIEWKG